MPLKIEMKNIKTFKGHDGYPGYSCDVFVNGKKVCDAFEDCRGGELEIHWHDRSAEAILQAHVDTLPPIPPKPELGYKEMKIDIALFIEEEVNKALNEREDKKLLKKFAEVLHFKLPTHGVDEYGYNKKCAPTAANKALYKAKYPEIIFLDEHPQDWRKIAARGPLK